MYEWLEDEIAAANEPKFFAVDGPADSKLRRALQRTTVPAPRAYKEFVLRFGQCKLYRQDDYIDRYHVEVLASMRDAETHDQQELRWIGSYGGHPAYFKADLLSGDEESSVFEWIVGPRSHLRQAASGFEEWITTRCQQARKKYRKRRWEEIRCGPQPFTEQEAKIVRARERYQWRIVGFTKNRDVQFEVHNGSDIVLQYLSIGIDSKDASLGGGAEVPVSDIGPGQTRIVEVDCYKSLVSPQDIVAFDYPSPGPEDRGRYAEFETA